MSVMEAETKGPSDEVDLVGIWAEFMAIDHTHAGAVDVAPGAVEEVPSRQIVEDPLLAYAEAVAAQAPGVGNSKAVQVIKAATNGAVHF